MILNGGWSREPIDRQRDAGGPAWHKNDASRSRTGSAVCVLILALEVASGFLHHDQSLAEAEYRERSGWHAVPPNRAHREIRDRAAERAQMHKLEDGTVVHWRHLARRQDLVPWSVRKVESYAFEVGK